MKTIRHNIFKRKRAYLLSNEDESKTAFLTTKRSHYIDRDEWEVKRSPQYDRFAHQNYVPMQVLLDDGWWFECFECNRKVDSEAYDYYEDEPLSPVITEHEVFCSQECHDDFMQARSHRQAEKAKWSEFLTRNYPGVEDLYVLPGCDRSYAEWKIPGCQCKVRWYSDRPDVFSHSVCDTDAVQTYLAKFGLLRVENA